MLEGKVDLVAAILESSIDGSSKQSLQDKLDITSILLDEYLQMLSSKNLVRIWKDKDRKSESIKTTERGERFLELYDSIKSRYLTTKSG